MAIKRTKSQMPIDTGEWLDSPRINNLSYDLRGIWLTMLCYMWESPTRGIMAKANGKPYTQDQIIRLLDIDPLALSILLENGLLAKNDKGAYYSPDMVHRERVSKARRTAGRKGGEVMKDKILNPKIEETPPTIVEPPPTPAATPQKPALFKEDEVPETPPELSPEQKAKAEKKKKYKYAEFVTLTKDEYAKLCTEHTEEAVRRMIEILDNYKGQSGKRYKSDYRAILNWVVDRYNDEQLRYGIRPTTNATTAKSAGGFGTVAPYATGANPTATGASPQSGDAPEKGYSERF
ncbi:hypothetical protein [Lepagella muris]|uniref:Uncharacterized protein n=1 Tax=Lepagella muris TaxID=3032870 RepID=A0AC61RLL0_9BACT|nr:hypothetical protein [Lepagella muris]TGY80012.1 hypothetical protein E5331_04285 [Lepagella muris]THG53249.1 hypothetical protein E5984_04055 [Bacteroidales bacterium]TKC64864.1 hypothetical protein E5359_001750 [Bacteroidales bacterium]